MKAKDSRTPQSIYDYDSVAQAERKRIHAELNAYAARHSVLHNPLNRPMMAIATFLAAVVLLTGVCFAAGGKASAPNTPPKADKADANKPGNGGGKPLPKPIIHSKIIDLKTRTCKMRVTAYSLDKGSTGKGPNDPGYGITANGHKVKTGEKFCAASGRLPFGTMISIPNYNNGQPVPVLDRGGAIKGNRLDIFMDTREAALAWGVRDVNVTIVAGPKPNGMTTAQAVAAGKLKQQK